VCYPPRVIWTRELVLEYAGFKLDHVRKAFTRTVEALDAERDEKPDHRIRLDAADRVFDLANIKPTEVPSSPTTIVILWDTSAKEVPPVSVRMALSSGASSDSRAFPSSSVIEAGERPPSA